MTWQLAALVLLALAIAAGFRWYERTRPDARIVALVGTLAGFAALGRIAFAAVPNVKPTTDIVLVAGFALGGGPGFAVGALAGLTSNFFFGQGPWTPWQMAAWGAVGVLGAGLAVISRRRIGRITLAAVCGVCGFAFTVVQDIGDWITYSDHSLTQLGLYVGRGLGFDAVHAIGCVLFALAFGPALIRALQRFARRLNVTWIPLAAGGSGLPLLVLLAAAGVAGLGSSAAPARAADPSPAARAAGYLRGAQNPDGGFGAGPGQASDAIFSGWAALGLAAEGRSPLANGPSGPSVLDYVRRHPPGSDVGALERTILVTDAAGVSPRTFGGRDLVVALLRRRRADGSTAGQVNLTAFAVLALRSARAPVAAATVRWLIHAQNRDGGFGFAPGAGSDADDTGAVLEALAQTSGAGAGVGVARARTRAIAYLRRTQDRDGGFAAAPGAGSNAQSTAWAVQGLLAAGVAPGSVQRGTASPLTYLDALVGPTGAVAYARGQTQTPVWVTAEAVMALAGRPLPLAAVPDPLVAPVGATATIVNGAPRALPHRTPPPHLARRPAGRPAAPGVAAVMFAAGRRELSALQWP